MGFQGINYSSGAFFNRSEQGSLSSFQLDLVFDRDHKVITLCEMKYAQAKTGTTIIKEFERKPILFLNKKRKTIVTEEGVSESLRSRHYFDHIIILDEFFTTEVQ